MGKVTRQWRSLVSRDHVQCPICGHDHGCAIASDGIAVACLRVKDGCAKRPGTGEPITLKNGMGWMHFLDAKQHKGKPAVAEQTKLRAKAIKDKLKPAEVDRLIKQFANALTIALLAKACEQMKISESSLRDLEIGYSNYFRSFTFPMRDGKRRPIGIRLWRKLDDGTTQKGCIPGSRNGLFIPRSLDLKTLDLDSCSDAPIHLLVPEGPTTTGAALDLGFRAVGRPNAFGGVEYVQQLLSDEPMQEIAIVADADEVKWRGVKLDEPFLPGIEGALALADGILAQSGSLKIIKAPNKAKDLRDAKISGATIDDVLIEIVSAERLDEQRLAARHERIEQWRARRRAQGKR